MRRDAPIILPNEKLLSIPLSDLGLQSLCCRILSKDHIATR